MHSGCIPFPHGYSSSLFAHFHSGSQQDWFFFEENINLVYQKFNDYFFFHPLPFVSCIGPTKPISLSPNSENATIQHWSMFSLNFWLSLNSRRVLPPPPRMHHLSKRIKWWCGVTCKSNVCIPLTMAFTGKHRSFPEIQKLISEYEKYRFLYDTNSSEYIDRDKKKMAWEAIGRAMETTGKWRLLNTSSVYGITHWEKREWILLMISPFACQEQ